VIAVCVEMVRFFFFCIVAVLIVAVTSTVVFSLIIFMNTYKQYLASSFIAWFLSFFQVHVIVPQSAFRLDMPGLPSDATREQQEKELSQKTTMYLWGTNTARRQFCKRCGILPWYRPRSNPDGYGITLNCIDFENSISDDGNNNNSRPPPKPHVEFKKFNGQNWERFFEQSNIADQSKE
jgi:hypothetical protein